jgi:hypothetical protein
MLHLVGPVAANVSPHVDTKDIAALLLKTAGLVIFAYAIFDIPYYFLPHPRTDSEYSFIASFMLAAGMLALPIVLGLLLWFFPATVVNKIVSGDKLTEGLGVRDFERVALTVIGIWFVAYGVSDLVYRVGSLILMKRQFPDAPPVEALLGIIAAAAKLLVGFGLAVGAKGVLRAIAKVRGLTTRSSRRPKACSLRSHCFGFPRCARPRLTADVRAQKKLGSYFFSAFINTATQGTKGGHPCAH